MRRGLERMCTRERFRNGRVIRIRIRNQFLPRGSTRPVLFFNVVSHRVRTMFVTPPNRVSPFYHGNTSPFIRIAATTSYFFHSDVFQPSSTDHDDLTIEKSWLSRRCDSFSFFKDVWISEQLMNSVRGQDVRRCIMFMSTLRNTSIFRAVCE